MIRELSCSHEHNVCFRETDPLNGRAYLVFPELINLKKPLVEDDAPTKDGIAYTVSEAVENIFCLASVPDGLHANFTRANQLSDHAATQLEQTMYAASA